MKNGSSLASVVVLAVIAANPFPVDAAGTGRSNKAPDETTAPATPTPATAPAPPVPESTVGAPAAPEPAAADTPAPAPVPAPILPDAALTTTIELVRKSPIGRDPNAVGYLDLMLQGKASAAQVNDFATYVAKSGMPKVALSFQEYALRLEPQNAILWQNLGTIQRTTGSLGPAATSFKKAIAIDPINALAHYNLGAVYDSQGNYDEALEEYRRALVLDPGLADPRKNPQVVNNDNLLAVKLQIYHDQAGALGLPLLQLQKKSPPPKPLTEKPKAP